MNNRKTTNSVARLRLATNLFSRVYDTCITAWGIPTVVHQPLKVEIMRHLEWLQHIARHEGVRQALKLGKEARGQYLGLLQDKDITAIPFRKSSRNGVLVIVNKLFTISKTDYRLHQLSLTCLSIGRVVCLKPVTDLSSITDSFKGSSLKLEVLCNHLKDLKAPFLGRKPTPRWDGKIWYSNQKGPNGSSGWCSHLDAKALFSPTNQTHLSILKELAAMLGASALLRQAETLQARFEAKKSYKIGRLAIISDKEGKTRNIFLGDYYTQSVFRILNKTLMRILRSIPEDYTFRQDSSKETIQRWITQGHIVNGFDLSSATERFPLSLQKEVLSRVFGSSVSDPWERILKSLTFNHNGYDVKFRVGQPMGYYTSWAAFSLTHHAIVWIAAERAGVNPRDRYAIVGDDVIIRGTRLSKEYLSLLIDIGVEVNMFKSTKFHEPKGVVEFLKRLYLPHGEITPIPLNSLLETYHNISGVIGLQDVLEKIGLDQPLVKELISLLPRGNKEVLIGAPILQIKGEIPENVSSGNTGPWENLAHQFTLRYAGGNKGLSWPFTDREIILAFSKVIKSIIDKRRQDYSAFAMNVFEDSSMFIAKLAGKSRIYNTEPLPPTIPGGSMSVSELHPILLVLNEDFGDFFDTDLFLDQIEGQGIDLSVPVFKRITSLSSDRYLNLKERKLKELSTLIFKVHGVLNSTVGH